MFVEYVQFANKKVKDNSLSIDEFRNDKIPAFKCNFVHR